MKVAIHTMWLSASVDEVSDGIEFIQKIDNGQHYDLILMDIDMHKMDGIEATIKALIKKPQLKIVAVTMYWKEEYFQAMQKQAPWDT